MTMSLSNLESHLAVIVQCKCRHLLLGVLLERIIMVGLGPDVQGAPGSHKLMV